MGVDVICTDTIKKSTIQPVLSRKRVAQVYSNYKPKAKKQKKNSVGNKNISHVDRERLRRIELNEAYELLKNNIPQLKAIKSVPKIQILKTSTEYCKSLEEKKTIDKQEIETLRCRNSMLRNELRKNKSKILSKKNSFCDNEL